MTLLVSIVGLIPGQSHFALGLELLLVGLAIGGGINRLPTVQGGSENLRLVRWTIRIVATVPFVIGGASILAETGGGLYWIAAGIAFAILGAVANAWVLLVEILR